MSPGKALVGPLPTITFQSFSPRAERQAYDRPRDTMDLRYAGCTQHHPACDCREAEFAEELFERAAALDGIEDAAQRVLAGHHTYAWRRDPVTGEDVFCGCMCTGCQIARGGRLSAAWGVYLDAPAPGRAW